MAKGNNSTAAPLVAHKDFTLVIPSVTTAPSSCIAAFFTLLFRYTTLFTKRCRTTTFPTLLCLVFPGKVQASSYAWVNLEALKAIPICHRDVLGIERTCFYPI